jgi:hypothetical protein
VRVDDGWVCESAGVPLDSLGGEDLDRAAAEMSRLLATRALKAADEERGQ